MNKNKNLDMNRYPFDMDSLMNLSNKVDIEKVISQDMDQHLSQERSSHLGYSHEEFLYEYTYNDLANSEIYNKFIDNMRGKDVEKVVISGDLPAEKIIMVIKEAKKENLDFVILANPEFTGMLALGLLRKN